MRKTRTPDPRPSPFELARALLRPSRSEHEELTIEPRKANDDALDRLASVHLAVVERLAPRAASPDASPDDVQAYLGAAREARECVRARLAPREDGPLGGGSAASVTVKIEHAGLSPDDDFEKMNAKHEPGLAVPPGRPAS